MVFSNKHEHKLTDIRFYQKTELCGQEGKIVPVLERVRRKKVNGQVLKGALEVN